NQLPFPEESRTMLKYLHLRARRPRPSEMVPLPLAVDEVILRSMSIDPENRQPSARAFAAELRAALRTPTVAAAGLKRGIAVHVEIGVPRAARAETAETLLGEMTVVLSLATEHFKALGLLPAMATGNAGLFVATLPPADGEKDRTERARV